MQIHISFIYRDYLILLLVLAYAEVSRLITAFQYKFCHSFKSIALEFTLEFSKINFQMQYLPSEYKAKPN